MLKRKYLSCLLSVSAAAALTTPQLALSQVLEEIVVTAQKREQNLQDTPIAITAFGQDQLDKTATTDIQGLITLVPTLELSEGGTFRGGQLALRGISSSNFTEAGDPSVGLHLDGVYVARSEATNALMQDVERVEVLRGPQGTLFGRNATAGSVDIVAKKPTDVLEGYVGVSAGNYNQMGIRGALNVPVSDTLAVRAAIFSNKHDSYTDVTDGSISESGQPETGDQLSGRLSALYTPNEKFEWYVAADYQKDEGNNAYGVDPTLPDQRVAQINFGMERDHTLTFLRSRMSYDLNDEMSLVYLVGHTTMENSSVRPSGFGNSHAYYSIDHESTSHELQWLFDNDELHAVIGAFIFEESNKPAYLAIAGGGPLFYQQEVGAEANALFAQATYSLQDDLRITLGARYSEDEKFNIGGANYSCGVIAIEDKLPSNPACVQTGSNAGRETWNKPTYRVVLEKDTDTGMLYASVSTGYKSGNFGYANTPSYDEEQLTNYEIGGKFELFDNSLRLNAALFYMDYTDLQVTQVVAIDAVTNATQTLNAASATVKGFEVEYTWQPTANDAFEGYFAYLDATYDEFADIAIPENPAAGLQDLSGNSLPKAPTSTFKVAYTHDFDLSDGAVVTPRVSATWKDDYYVREFNLPVGRQDAYTNWDASLRYTNAEDTWYVEMFGKNLTDELILSSLSGVGNNPRAAIYHAPRTYGVQAQYRF